MIPATVAARRQTSAGDGHSAQGATRLPVAVGAPFIGFFAVFLLTLSALGLLLGVLATRHVSLVRGGHGPRVLGGAGMGRLSLLLNGRTSRLRHGLHWEGPLHFFASPLNRLWAWWWGGRTGGGSALNGIGRWLPRLLLRALPHYGVTRLVAVFLVVNLDLLLGSGVAIARILPLVDR